MSPTDVQSRQSMRIRAVTLLGLLVAVAACATAGTAKIHAGPAQRFSMVGNGTETSALITADGAQGPQVDVGRYDNGTAIRGTVFNQTLALTVSGNSAEGLYGSGPIKFAVTETPDGVLNVQGLIAGVPSTFSASKETINGNMGPCSYQLGRQGDSYVGSRSCGGGIGQVSVSFPSTILTWKPINIAVLMALLMSAP